MNEYTATIAYELLKEGEEGRQKVDAVTMTLRAEGILEIKNKHYVLINMESLLFSGSSFLIWLYYKNRWWASGGQSYYEVQQEEERPDHRHPNSWLWCGGRIQAGGRWR